MNIAFRDAPERLGNALAREIVQTNHPSGGEVTRAELTAGDPARDALLARYEQRGVIQPTDSSKKRYRRVDFHRFSAAFYMAKCGIALRDVDAICAGASQNLHEAANETLVEHLYTLSDTIAQLKWQMNATRAAVARLAAHDAGEDASERSAPSRSAPIAALS